MNFDGIYNYYERLVYAEIIALVANLDLPLSKGDAKDVACIALNQLPARYVRHSVDAAYYLPSEELTSMRLAVVDAVKNAVEKVKASPSNLR